MAFQPQVGFRYQEFPEKDFHVLSIFVGFRLFSYLIVHTWFVPDEFYQILEPAHNAAFGYGYMTWEFKEGARSSFLPLLGELIFKKFELVGLDSVYLLNKYCRIYSAIGFAWGDYCTYQIAQCWFGKGAAKWTAVCMGTNWFLAYCAPRTLASCYEMVLVASAFYKYPWDVWREKEYGHSIYILLGGMACLIRPTAAIPLFSLFVLHVKNGKKKIEIITHYILAMIFMLWIQWNLDFFFYGSPEKFSPWVFFRFNVLSGLAATYGTHPWHWYLTQGLPATCGFHLIPATIGLVTNYKRYEFFFYHIGLYITVLSCIGHKEFRFLLPIMPCIMVVSGDVLWNTFLPITKYMKICIIRFRWRNNIRFSLKPLVVACIIVVAIPNFIALCYFGMVHQRGPMDAIHEIHTIARNQVDPDVMILMPCHSTPLYSHIHKNISIRFLTCEPNLSKEENYIDEADLFYIDPLGWLKNEYSFVTECRSDQQDWNKNRDLCSKSRMKDSFLNIVRGLRPLPSHLVMFNKLTPQLAPLLVANEYTLCHDLFNSHFEEGRRGTRIHIYCKKCEGSRELIPVYLKFIDFHEIEIVKRLFNYVTVGPFSNST